jgi:dihydrolipoamide dehydrogenase
MLDIEHGKESAVVMGELALETQVLVIGAGPGGYAAAFRAADLGLEVALVDIGERPGGVCLYRGCIASKALLHVAELLHDVRGAPAMGIRFGEPQIDIDTLRQWKNAMIARLSDGLVALTQQRNIQFIQGRATFEGPGAVRLAGADVSRIRFKHAIVATGSRPAVLSDPPAGSHPRVMTATEALELADIPATLLVVGGGYIGLELGSVYAALGSRVTLVESGPRLLAGLDEDLVRILSRRLAQSFTEIHLRNKIVELTGKENGVDVVLQSAQGQTRQSFAKVLVAVGRRADFAELGLGKAGVALDASGFIQVDDRQRTSNPAILAVGDAVGGVMLAHKATFQGKIAAEVIAGEPSAYDVRAIPAIVYTDPQVAWVGMTEAQATQQGIAVEVKRFPWKISGRAASMGLEDGLTKMIVESGSRRIVGVGAVGRAAEALVAEAVLAIEMGALADDVALSMHPHPTLSETHSEVAEIFLGRSTHIIARPPGK